MRVGKEVLRRRRARDENAITTAWRQRGRTLSLCENSIGTGNDCRDMYAVHTEFQRPATLASIFILRSMAAAVVVSVDSLRNAVYPISVRERGFITTTDVGLYRFVSCFFYFRPTLLSICPMNPKTNYYHYFSFFNVESMTCPQLHVVVVGYNSHSYDCTALRRTLINGKRKRQLIHVGRARIA